MAKSTKEFAVLKRSASKIQRAITDAKLLSTDLFSEGLISLPIIEKVNDAVNKTDARMELVTNLLHVASIDPKIFHKLLQVLENHSQLLAAVATEIKEDYGKDYDREMESGNEVGAEVVIRKETPSAVEVAIEKCFLKQAEFYDRCKENHTKIFENTAITKEKIQKKAEDLEAAAKQMSQDFQKQVSEKGNVNPDDFAKQLKELSEKTSLEIQSIMMDNAKKCLALSAMGEPEKDESTSIKEESDIDVHKVTDEVQQTQADQLLDITDLATVFQELTSSQQFNCTDWYQLGLYLGLYERTLKAIEEENKGNLKKCLMECLSSWLKGEDGVRETRGGGSNWISLVAALDTMGQRKVADDIRKKYLL
ncbi:PREDICTED: uncharacterized protein LOC109582613 [Amphimedon queenslandica]|uniref:Death domain-containing protein n=1 Tax=Amphimedon queenslandica TaxID=400682 RepID=A0A1X7UQ36_AMPQE|nr:PREDICTED: uncharacterized protein LOC109582613 [Amphimedon queenslandica]|eukprot:XP_019853014.1 PREDICTED: uncharacterized protein LOC109582613 [Amphimedon queenslandica]